VQTFVCGRAKEAHDVDVTRGEIVEAELDRLIAKRASQDRRPNRDEQEEIWKASVRAYNARREAKMRAARVEYHRGQAARLAATLDALVSYHEGQAAKLMDVQPKGAA
jgi:hypothetical protein